MLVRQREPHPLFSPLAERDCKRTRLTDFSDLSFVRHTREQTPCSPAQELWDLTVDTAARNIQSVERRFGSQALALVSPQPTGRGDGDLNEDPPNSCGFAIRSSQAYTYRSQASRSQAGDEDEPDAEAVLPTPPASPVQQRDTAPDETRHAPCVGEEDGHGAGTAEAAAAAPAAADTARLYLPQSQETQVTPDEGAGAAGPSGGRHQPRPTHGARGVLLPPQPGSLLATALQDIGAAVRAQGDGQSGRGACHTPVLEPLQATDDDSRSADAGFVSPPPCAMFLPSHKRKVLYSVRHGESTFNAASATSRSFEDPVIYDAILTDRGRSQALQLRGELRSLGGLKKALFVVSPLQRTLETFMLGCPDQDWLDRSCPPDPEGPRVIINSLMAEHCWTRGDVGHPTSRLRQRFRKLAPHMADLPELWWHRPHKNSAVEQKFSAPEKLDEMQARVAAFKAFLAGRSERVIVLVGHSTFLKCLTNSGALKNCEVHTSYRQ